MIKLSVRKIIFICALGIIFSINSVFASDIVAKPVSSSRGNLDAPAFKLKTLNGKEETLNDHKGKSVILFFFTTWCPHCRSVIPFLYDNIGKFKKEGIDLITVDVGESPAKIKSYLNSKKVDFDVLLDSNSSVSRLYSVVGVPTFVFISEDGKIVYFDNMLPEDYQRYFK